MSERKSPVVKCPKCGGQAFNIAPMLVLNNVQQPVGIVCANDECEHLVTALWSTEMLLSIAWEPHATKKPKAGP